MTLIKLLQEKAISAIKKAFDEDVDTSIAEITICQDEKFGHYQCNSALKLSKTLKQNPRNVAEKLIENFDKQIEDAIFIDSLEIAGPGFINIKLNSNFLSNQLQKVQFDKRLGVEPLKEKQKIIVEFSSPNIAKELHVGHLRSTIIGDSIARLFEFLGHDVLRLNHIGDWGTQFGMLIAYMNEHVPEVFRGEKLPDLQMLTHWYRESKKHFEKDEEFKKRAKNQVVKLQAGDEKARYAWNLLCDISRQAFEEIYDLLDISITERGESFYNPQLPILVQELTDKGLIEISDGAKCIFLEGFTNREGKPLPLMVQKSDGGYNYDTTDMAALHHRIFEEKADRIIIVTDAGQSLHFQMIFAAGKKAGYLEGNNVELDHVPFGVVLGEDKTKFRTRAGDVEKLIDLLTKAVIKAKEILIERLPVLEEKEINQLAKTLGIDAVKYSDLSCLRTKDYVFSYNRMLQLEGNTAAFLLYAYVRILGIKRKTKANMQEILDQKKINLQHPSEICLGFHLLRFPEILEAYSKDLLPNRLCEYLYNLAEKFNAFFRDCRVDGSEEEEERLLLCEVCGKVLKKGLEILGLKTMDRM